MSSDSAALLRRVMASENFYDRLGAQRFVAPSRDEYVKLVKLLHPDKCGEHGTVPTQRLNEAWNALKDPEGVHRGEVIRRPVTRSRVSTTLRWPKSLGRRAFG